MVLFTIGFTGHSAEAFFTALRGAGVRRVIDVRLKNTSQLCGFSKRNDLPFFLRGLLEVGYNHVPSLAPTQEILAAYQRHVINWASYETWFNELIRSRRVETLLDSHDFDQACLLCSERSAQHCHRRLVAEYFRANRPPISIEHLS